MLPNTSVMSGSWWVKLPFNPFLNECIADKLLVPIVDVEQKFFLARNKVCSVVGPNNRWDATTGAKLFYSHHTATDVRTRNYFKVNSASLKETPTFFSGPLHGHTPHGHREGSKIIYTSVRESKSVSQEV